MAEVIYSLKIWMFQDQFKLTKRETDGLSSMVLFAVRIYLKYWIEAPLTVSAPRNDLDTLKLLHDYHTQDEAVAKAALGKLLGHGWYLSEELVALAFFDVKVSVDMKRKMIDSMKNQEGSEDRVLRVKILRSGIPAAELSDFCTRSTEGFFDKLGLDKGFLEVDPDDWEHREDFVKASQVAAGLSVVNDHAERGVALVQEYSSHLTKDEDQLQYILQVVQDHRKRYPDAREKTLMRE